MILNIHYTMYKNKKTWLLLKLFCVYSRHISWKLDFQHILNVEKIVNVDFKSDP